MDTCHQRSLSDKIIVLISSLSLGHFENYLQIVLDSVDDEDFAKGSLVEQVPLDRLSIEQPRIFRPDDPILQRAKQLVYLILTLEWVRLVRERANQHFKARQRVLRLKLLAELANILH